MLYRHSTHAHYKISVLLALPLGETGRSKGISHMNLRRLEHTAVFHLPKETCWDVIMAHNLAFLLVIGKPACHFTYFA